VTHPSSIRAQANRPPPRPLGPLRDRLAPSEMATSPPSLTVGSRAGLAARLPAMVPSARRPPPVRLDFLSLIPSHFLSLVERIVRKVSGRESVPGAGLAGTLGHARQHPAPKKPCSCVVVGLGKQMREVYFPALNLTDRIQIAGAVDADPSKQSIADDAGINFFSTSLSDALAKLHPDFVLLTLPHSQYASVTPILMQKGVPVYQEKPFAANLADGQTILASIKKHNGLVHVAMNRRVHPVYWAARIILATLGDIVHVEGRFTLQIDRLDAGWRASHSKSGGGAILDIGYHAFDLLLWYFGCPTAVSAMTTQRARPSQVYDVEDTASIKCEYKGTRNFIATLVLSRVYPEKSDGFTIVGTQGSVVLQRGKLTHFDQTGSLLETITREGTWIVGATHQLLAFTDVVRSGERTDLGNAEYHLQHLNVIDACYRSASAGGKKVAVTKRVQGES
jgi:predicted dehydrogenase